MRVCEASVCIRRAAATVQPADKPAGFADNISNYSVAVNTSIVKMLFVLEEDAPY